MTIEEALNVVSQVQSRPNYQIVDAPNARDWILLSVQGEVVAAIPRSPEYELELTFLTRLVQAVYVLVERDYIPLPIYPDEIGKEP